MAATLLALPAPALGHQLVGRLESPLPLAVYLAGAAMAVALSFAFVLLRDVRAPEERGEPRLVRAPGWLVNGLRAIGLIGWLWIVVQTIVGGSSAASVAPLFLWVYGWVGVAIVSAFVGPIWRWVDPFSTIFDIGAAVAGRLGIAGWEPASYPERLGAWPAAAGMVFFVGLELVFHGADLGMVLIAYTALTLLGMANFGRDVWRSQAETFGVWFGLLNRMASFAPAPVVGDDPRLLVRRSFGAGLVTGDWTTPKLVIVAIGVASILFDGLSQTQAWFDVFGFPALPIATFELLVFLGLVVGIALLVARYVGLAAVGAGLLPIAMGYLLAHYLTYLLGDGQLIVVALSDPLQLGWDLLGTAFYEANYSWMPPLAVWTVMLVGVVGGHMVGAWSGHVVASRGGGGDERRAARLRQIPLAFLMVGLTATTLWSLGQAIVQEQPPAAVAPAAAATRPHG
ncbi:MAG TPA: hypothetical protein VFP56_10800 [Candidatus Limnocylindrales bacterium]|nr:hypothetical protein [Candidatus Limnocylindrales bacterium]